MKIKSVLPFVFYVLFSIVLFGQQNDNSVLDTLRLYHSEIDSLFKEYKKISDKGSGLRKVEEQYFMDNLLELLQRKCTVGRPYYEYLKATESLDTSVLSEYNVAVLCKKVEAESSLNSMRKYRDTIQGLDKEFNETMDSLKSVELPKKFEELTTRLNKLKKEIFSNCEKADQLTQYLTDDGTIDQAVIDAYTPVPICSSYKGTQGNKTQPKKFIIVGDGNPIHADSLFTSSTAKETFYNAIDAQSATQLGTFLIPKEDFEISLYVEGHLKRKPNSIKKGSDQFVTLEKYFELISTHETKNSNDAKKKKLFRKGKLFHGRQMRFALKEDNNLKSISKIDLPSKLLFQSIAFEIKEGGLVDIRLKTVDKNSGIQMYFESRAPVSLLNYTIHADRSFLHFSNKFSDQNNSAAYQTKLLEHLRIRVSDVLHYDPKIGNNYVPEDLAFELPKDLEKEKTENEPRSYQLINDSSLKNMLDLRAYTDFLGLFGDEANGLFQLEGKADFFLNPFNFNRSSIYLFKKVTPFIRYSRLEEDNEFISTEILESGDAFGFDNDRLELLEKSNLEFGIDFDVFTFRPFKESPFWASLHLPINYYTSKVRPFGNENGENDFNFNTLGYGLALRVELKRLNNFGLSIGTSFKEYSFLGDYSGIVDSSNNSFEEPNRFRTHSVDAEIFYFPNNSKTQSIFLRMRGFRDISDGDASFYQLQFGYRFTVGAGNVKAKN
ncbi:hypothetical protein FGF1_29710 [Flavobacteriaceae bacterium GF1]